MVEGVTDYYADLLVHRAGLSSRDEYLNSLSSKIEELQTTPGRTVQSAELASFDAWIRYYRPDENSPNVSISYYTKGAVLAFLQKDLAKPKPPTLTGALKRSLEKTRRKAA